MTNVVDGYIWIKACFMVKNAVIFVDVSGKAQ